MLSNITSFSIYLFRQCFRIYFTFSQCVYAHDENERREKGATMMQVLLFQWNTHL